MTINLRCISPEAAEDCAAFLTSKGLTTVTVNGNVVHAERLTPMTVISIAEDALEHDWAHDEDAAAIIAEMG